MQSWTATAATTASYDFGEGLRWDAATGSLLWVDLLAGRLHRAPLTDLDAVETLVELDEPLGAVAPCASGGWLLACGQGLAALAEDGTVTPLRTLEPPQNRMNDAACDLQGRFWAGSMAYDESADAGSLWRVDLDGGIVRVRSGVTIGNGPAFSADGRTLYLDDSGRQSTTAFTLDPAGALSEKRLLVRHTEGTGDGLVVDDDGHLWIAVFGGSAVRRYDPQGRLVGEVAIAASQVSSCALADGRLYATTVRTGLADPEPAAGRLFVADVGISGPPVRPFRGVLPFG